MAVDGTPLPAYPTPLAVYRGHLAAVQAVHFLPSGGLVSASQDGELHVWHFDDDYRRAYAATKAMLPRCFAPKQLEAFGLRKDPLDWCRSKAQITGNPRRIAAMYTSAKSRGLQVVVLSAIVLATMMTSVRADSIWNHNGSTMMLNVDGSRVAFSYLQPRSVIAAQGVESGTVLFSGRRSRSGSLDDWGYAGTAYIFSANCGKHAFAVKGTDMWDPFPKDKPDRNSPEDRPADLSPDWRTRGDPCI